MTSVQHRVLAAGFRSARVKHWFLAPSRFTGPGARRQRHAPPWWAVRGVRVDRDDVEGWPVHTVTPRGGTTAGSVLYLHGGAYAMEIQPSHWMFVARLAARSGRAVTVPIYPLVPHATHRDVLPVLRRLHHRLGATTTGRPAVMGDSAGAGLALALAQAVAAESPDRAGELVLLSPWLDATLADPAVDGIAPLDPMLNPDHLRELGRLWAGDDDPADPPVSPLHGPLTGLGRVVVVTGTRDVLNPDARRLRDLAAAAGADLTYLEAPGRLHDFMLLPVPEARIALDRIVAELGRTADQTV